MHSAYYYNFYCNYNDCIHCNLGKCYISDILSSYNLWLFYCVLGICVYCNCLWCWDKYIKCHISRVDFPKAEVTRWPHRQVKCDCAPVWCPVKKQSDDLSRYYSQLTDFSYPINTQTITFVCVSVLHARARSHTHTRDGVSCTLMTRAAHDFKLLSLAGQLRRLGRIRVELRRRGFALPSGVRHICVFHRRPL